ncbi:MAG TPA: sodium:proton antiporter [Methanoregulaceae archaeon]|nr:sodium:proton antiporter [Methanoregulaceae archaeon]
MFWNLPYIAVVILSVIGLATILLKRNLIKIFFGVSILTSAVNLFIIALGYREGGIAPIYTYAVSENMVMATPQALTLTSIVIGVATSALMLSFAVIIYKTYGTVNVDEIRELKE